MASRVAPGEDHAGAVVFSCLPRPAEIGQKGKSIVSVRNYVFFKLLGSILNKIGNWLERPDEAVAYGETKEIEEHLARVLDHAEKDVIFCERLIGFTVPSDADLKRELLTTVHRVHGLIGHIKERVSTYLGLGTGYEPPYTGDEESYCSHLNRIRLEGLRSAWEQSGPNLLDLAAKCWAEASLIYPRGCEESDVLEEFDFDPYGDDEAVRDLFDAYFEAIKQETTPDQSVNQPSGQRTAKRTTKKLWFPKTPKSWHS